MLVTSHSLSANRIHAMYACPQALLDVYTIKREIGRLENFSIGLVGDLANGRTVRSLAYLLSMYPGVKMYFVAPEVVRMKEDIKHYLDRCAWLACPPAVCTHLARPCVHELLYIVLVSAAGFGHLMLGLAGRPHASCPCSISRCHRVRN